MLDYGRYKYLKIDRSSNVAVVTMNRPEVLNAFNEPLHQEMTGIWLDLQEDPQVYAVVLTGEGRAFSSGGDFNWLGGLHKDFTKIRATLYETIKIVNNLLALEKPLIGAINGPATGLGATLAFFCDILIASERARIGDTHVRAGVVAGDGAIAVLPLLVGIHRAKELMMMGKLLNAQEAERIGLFNEVVPHDELMPRALAVAQELAELPPWPVRWTKYCLNQWLKTFASSAFNTAISLEAITMFSEDFMKAVVAFRDRSNAQYEGR